MDYLSLENVAIMFLFDGTFPFNRRSKGIISAL